MNSYALSSLKRSPLVQPRFRPNLDILEDRTCPAILPGVNLPIELGAVTPVITGGQVTGLQAPVLLGGVQIPNTFVTMNATTMDNPSSDCPILDLQIQPINLNLLGLEVKTSAICLEVEAERGPGNLLGNLLCGITNASNGLNLNQIFEALNVAGENTLLGQLDNLVNELFDEAFNVTSVLGTSVTNRLTQSQAPGTTCDILDLSLGPIDLDLLGLTVELDNCADGPVTVEVNGVQGQLLGDLLCGLAGGLNGQLINRLIGRLDNVIDRLTDIAENLDDIGQLPGRLGNIANRLLDQIERLVDRVDSLADLDRLVNRLDRLVNRLDRLIDNTDLPNPVATQLSRLLGQIDRIVNRLDDLGAIGRLTNQLERTLDRLFAAL